MAATVSSQSSGVQQARAAPAASRWLRRALNLAHRDTLACIGALFLLGVFTGAAFAPVFSPYNPTTPNVRERLALPSPAHPFGTDELGRDLFARILYGARPILATGVLSVCVALLLGGAIGTASGYRGGWLDNALMRLMDIVLSFPAILFAILIVAALGAGLVNLIIAITFSLVPVFARLTRSFVLSLNHQDYVLAARTLGCGDGGIVCRHLLPNMLPLLLVQTTALLATAFSTSAALSFLGLGVAPPTPDWGMMVSDGQRLVFDAPHVPFFPGLVIALTVMSVNFVGDGLRDHLDPALRNR
ncbi:MAG: ABC transporter permease [Roseiflexaceae bacterium]|nr:ABC transporter permease [Roseiflexaceae bacterium]